ncbi:MAG: DUF1549 and DUF1553 domain-containing protein [Planctomycetes bacterium]|nr:DUF1549 and DUF1553 domain-containing protein [Planctomycetota bacterium]
MMRLSTRRREYGDDTSKQRRRVCERRRSVAVCVFLLLLGLTFNASASADEAAGVSQPKLLPIEMGTPERVEVFPKKIHLTGTRERAQLVVTGFYPSTSNATTNLQDLTRVATIRSADNAVARVSGSVILPVADGHSKIEVRVAGHTVSVPVTTSGQSREQPVSFLFDTLAALSKQGCSSGGCHGSPVGKGGFRLSLRAFDPQLDELTLMREFGSRRTNTNDPSKSLLLLKPLGEVAHGGGRRLSKKDSAYEILHDWVTEGRSKDPENSPHCVKVDVYPPSGRLLRFPAHTQQLAVRAHFSDDSIRDITHLAVYSTSDDYIASVTPEGLVVGHDRGEAAVIVRYLEHIEARTMTFVKDIDSFAWTDPPATNYVDRLVHEKLRQLKYLPSERCGDYEFIRRVYLDVLGVLPTIKEVETFVAAAPQTDEVDKRTRLIDEVLERPEYASFWALKWGDLLRLTRIQVGDEGVYKYHRWLRNAFAANMPYDRFVRELLTAGGSTFVNPTANYFRGANDPSGLMESTTQVFLGARLQCAKCHNHPFERWTQDNYYGMSAFFGRVKAKKTARPEELVIWTQRSGEVTHPRTGRVAKPWVPVRGEIKTPSDGDRRPVLVDWLTNADNPYLAKVEVNRIWSHLLGRGIVEPFDDFRDTNPPAIGALLDALAEDFVAHGFDRKYIIRTILNSRTYQASSTPNEFNTEDIKYFSHFRPRMLTAEQIVNAISQVSGVAGTFAQLPVGARATDVPSPDVLAEEESNSFLKIFGQSERQTVCECERSGDARLGQALQLFNGKFVQDKLVDQDNRFRRLIKANRSNEEILRELYLSAYARTPSEGELRQNLEYIARSEDRGKALEDITWVLLNANEFLFQH